MAIKTFSNPHAGGIGEKPIFAARLADGAVAQSVEQRTENPCVGGSIPPHTTDKQ